MCGLIWRIILATSWQAKVCPNEECTVRMHDYCLKNKLSKNRVLDLILFVCWQPSTTFLRNHKFFNIKFLQGGISCPNCGTQWQHLIPKSKAIEDNNEPEGSESQALAGSRRRKLPSNRNHGAETEATEEHNEPDDTENRPPTESRRKRLRTNNRNGTVVTSEFDSSQVSYYASDSRRVTRSSARR